MSFSLAMFSQNLWFSSNKIPLYNLRSLQQAHPRVRSLRTLLIIVLNNTRGVATCFNIFQPSFCLILVHLQKGKIYLVHSESTRFFFGPKKTKHQHHNGTFHGLSFCAFRQDQLETWGNSQRRYKKLQVIEVAVCWGTDPFQIGWIDGCSCSCFHLVLIDGCNTNDAIKMYQ